MCAAERDSPHTGDQVWIRSWGDDNGARPYDDTTTLRVGTYLPELGLVRLLNEQGGIVGYFDLDRRRLRPVVEQAVDWFSAPAGYRSRVAREALGAALAPVARALGIAVNEVPSMPLGALTPSATAQGTLEAHGAAKPEAVAWRWMRRFYPDGGFARVGPHQMSVEIEGVEPLRASVSVFVQAAEYANFVMHGSIEVMPRALQWRAQAIAEWTAMTFPEND